MWKRVVPRWLKEKVKKYARGVSFHLLIKKMQKLPLGTVPSRSLLEQLHMAWSNEGYSADVDYLEEVARRAATTSGPILECGSGLTTVVIGLLAGRRDVDIWALEHDSDWYYQVNKILQQYQLSNVNLSHCPLRSYGQYTWYEIPLDQMPKDFQFIVCDGPPDTTPGGRYGLLPIMRQSLGKSATILLDDADRSSEIDTVKKWKEEFNMSYEVVTTPHGRFAVLTPPSLDAE